MVYLGSHQTYFLSSLLFATLNYGKPKLEQIIFGS